MSHEIQFPIYTLITALGRELGREATLTFSSERVEAYHKHAKKLEALRHKYIKMR